MRSCIVVLLLLLIGPSRMMAQDDASKSNRLKNYLVYLDQKKDVGIGIALWLVCPVAGPVYSGNYVAAAAFGATEAVTLVGLFSPASAAKYKISYAYAFGILRLGELVATVINVDSYNKNLRVKLGIMPTEIGLGATRQLSIHLSLSL